jgi:ABC-type multidrug transport system fused ATPase/permease subunit
MNSLKNLLPYIKPYRWHLLVVILSTLGITATGLVNPWLVRNLIQIVRVEEGNLSAAADSVIWLTFWLIVTYLLRGGFRYLASYIAHIMAWSFVSDLRVMLYGHLQKLSPRYYADRQTGDILTRVISDTRDIEPLLAHYIPDMIVNTLLLAGVALILFSLNPTLALLTLIPIPFLALAARKLGSRMDGAFRAAARGLGMLSSVVQDNISGIKEIQIFTQEEREFGRVSELSQRNTRDRLYALKLQAILVPTFELLAGVGLIIVVWFGGHTAIQGGLAVEDLVAFVLYLNIFYQPVTLFAQMNEMLQVAIAGVERVHEVMDIPPDVADAPDAVDPGRLQGEIILSKVRFDYVEGIDTLKDISLTVKPGQTLALVGPTGAGKSTISSLIPRFYDVTEGQVKIDGLDVRQIKLEALRRNISMVRQDVFLFNGTVRENIRYSKPHATDEEIVAAAKIANAHHFIDSLMEGYDTQIGERGLKLSGGQKQRLAIARAVLKDAPILILDEATSSVDPETEIEIQEALQQLMKGKTSIVIAHRLSTIRNADLIAVVDDGRIVEAGSHAHLLAEDGLYHRLYRANVAV